MRQLLDAMGRLLPLHHEYGVSKDLLLMFAQVNNMVGKEAQRKGVPVGTMIRHAQEIIMDARAEEAQVMHAEKKGEGV
jgi:hypothetical protein